VAFRRRRPAAPPPYPGEATAVTRVDQEAAPPPPGPPPGWLAWENPWPWLAAFLILVVAGLLVWLLVFRSSNRATVPPVVGMQYAPARTRLNDAGFNVRAVFGPSVEPRGIVASQSPGGGAQLKKNQTVVIHVSNGRRPTTSTTTATTTAATTTRATTTTAAPTVAMPDVVGKQQTAGAGTVEAAGLVADTFPVHSTQPAGTIVSESPSAGAQVKAGQSVRLSVSAGNGTQPSKSVPSVTGQKAAEARTALWTASFTVRTTYRSGAKAQIGTVLSQQPSGGASAPAYTQVTLTVGR
jgi:beta-lactam-binding protein with PASTA domain